MMSIVDEVFSGCIDLHVHPGPDPWRERLYDAMQAAIKAKEAGMGGFVMKAHDSPTALLAWAVSQIVKDIGLFGSIALNTAVGGINPAAVEVAGRLGAKIVWMPTITAKGNGAGSSSSEPSHKRIIGVFDEDGRLIPALYDVLDIVRRHDMAIATGHLSRAESFAVIDAAREKGVKKIIYTHPMLEMVGEPLSVEDQKEAARRGATIEHCVNFLLPTGEGRPPEVMADAIKAVGAAHCVLSTDAGGIYTISSPEGMRLFIACMLRCGISKTHVELMVKTNPAQLLGL